jgi:hypothetical protein
LHLHFGRFDIDRLVSSPDHPAPGLGWLGMASIGLGIWLLEARPSVRLREPKIFAVRFEIGELSAKRSARTTFQKASHLRLPAREHKHNLIKPVALCCFDLDQRHS